MAKAQSQLKKALKTYFHNDAACSTLRSLLTVNGKINIYADNAVEIKTPYLVYTMPSNNMNYAIGGNMDYINLQITIYDKNNTLGNIIPIAVELEDVMDGKLFTLESGYECFYNMLQVSFELFPDKESCQIVQRYKIGISYQVV